MDFNIIKKLIALISIGDFKNLLFSKVKESFMLSFNNANNSFGWNSKPNPSVLKYLETRESILSKTTLDRLTGNLSLTIAEGINNKESITEITVRLDKIFVNMEKFELERLARTEVLNATNAGTLNSFQESKIIKYKVWKATINNKRTSDDSKRLHNQIQLLSDNFKDPKTGLTCPHPPNRPNCRCTIIGLSELPKNIKRKNGLMYLE